MQPKLNIRIALVDTVTSFYDRHWAFALTATLRKCGVKDIFYINVLPKLRFVKAIVNIRPDLVLYSAFSHGVPLVAIFDAYLKSLYKCKSVLGGAGATFTDIKITETTLDAICIGEGEIAIRDYLESGLISGRNLITKEKPDITLAPLIDLSLEPMPDRSVVYHNDRLLARIPSKAFITGRGCPYYCTYCFNHIFNKMFGTKVRKRPVGQVIDEIRHIRDNYPLNFLLFQDDTFCIEKNWLAEFSEHYPREIGLPFSCNVRPNLVDDDVVKMLKLAGVRAVSWSVESANDILRNDILKRNVTKGEMDRTAELFRKYGIQYRIANIIGIPGETTEQVMETIDYNVQLGSVFTSANIFTPYAKLELTEYAIKHGYLDPKRIAIPKNYFVGSVLNVNRSFEDFLIKSYCLLPYFVWFPALWRNKTLRRLAYGIHRYVLRVIYELTFLAGSKLIYGLRISPRIALSMTWRYIKSL